jgi:hypothetical protein
VYDSVVLFSIRNIDDQEKGYVEIDEATRTITVLIDEQRLRWIAGFLNGFIREKTPTVGVDGVERVITDLASDEERAALFSKIESLSGGYLRVSRQ